jgi:hypothetical protein
VPSSSSQSPSTSWPPTSRAIAFGLSAGAAFFNPAASSLLPALVKQDELVTANSAIWSAAVLSQILMRRWRGC